MPYDAWQAFICPYKLYETFFFVRTKKQDLDKKTRLLEPWLWPAGRPAQAAQKAESGLSKVFIFDRFYKVFDMAEYHVVYSEKPNAFLIIFEANLRVGLQNDQNSTGFIRYLDQLFSMLQNGLGPMLFDISQSRKTPSTFSENPNAF